jgi:hypothetical protein
MWCLKQEICLVKETGPAILLAFSDANVKS